MAKPVSPPRVAVLGAGPVGLEAALYAKALGLPVAVYDRANVGEHVQHWGFVRMFTPFGLNVSALGRAALLRDAPDRKLPADTDLLTGREFREAYLAPLAESTALKGLIHPQSAVVAVGRAGWRKTDPGDPKKPLPPFRLLLRDAKGAERFAAADVVLDCTGTYSRPNWVGDGGIPAAGEAAARPHVMYWLDDVRGPRKPHYAGKSVAVVGGGYSAAATVCGLADVAEEHQATWVVWLTHGPKAQPLPRIPNDPFKERDRLAVRANSLAMRCDANLEYHPQTQIDEMVCAGPDQGFRITGRVGGKPATWEVERVVANVGYRPDVSFAAELRVDDPRGDIATGEPGYFVLGAKSRGRDSAFLLRDGHDQVRRAFAAISAKPGLDLYAKKAA
jgi:thioredoxin reductase